MLRQQKLKNFCIVFRKKSTLHVFTLTKKRNDLYVEKKNNEKKKKICHDFAMKTKKLINVSKVKHSFIDNQLIWNQTIINRISIIKSISYFMIVYSTSFIHILLKKAWKSHEKFQIACQFSCRMFSNQMSISRFSFNTHHYL